MTRTDSVTTEDRLLIAAVSLFASQGYAATSVRQICEQADANVAAVNYHFRSKRGLYDAAIDHARASSVARNTWVELDIDKNFWADEEPEIRLRRFVSMMLDHSLDMQGQPSELARIMIHEMLDPTPAFDRQVELSIRRVFEALAEICNQISEQSNKLCPDGNLINSVTFLICGQCMYPALVSGLPNHLHPGISFDAEGRAALAELIISAALSCLR